MQTKLFPVKSVDEKNFQETCEQAIRLLVFAGKQAPVEVFLHGLKHVKPSIRIESISALLRLQARYTRSSLRPLLHDEQWEVQVAAAWALACWGEPVPHELLDTVPPPRALLRRIAEAFPANWSQLFPLEPALVCIAVYHGLWEIGSWVAGEWGDGIWPSDRSENTALFRRLAQGIDPQSFQVFLRHYSYNRVEYGAWKILRAMENPLPLDMLPVLLCRGDAIALETALLLGKQRIVAASDVLREMWTLSAGYSHAAITVALDDLGVLNGVDTLCARLQEGHEEAPGITLRGRYEEERGAIWGLGILGQKGRHIPHEMLHQMVSHTSPLVRAEAIIALSLLNDIDLKEALMAINDDRLEPVAVAASLQALRVLAHTQNTLPIEVLTDCLIDLMEQKFPRYNYSHYGFYVAIAARNGIQLFDELHADIPLKVLLDALSAWNGSEALILNYWRRHAPDIFAEMMVQAEAFLRQHI